MTRFIDSVSAYFYGCDVVTAPAKSSAQEVINLLRKHGAFFYRKYPFREDASPMEWVDNDGNSLIPIHFGHSGLMPERFHPKDANCPTASLGIVSSVQIVSISQSSGFEDMTTVDALANAMLAFACGIYPHLKTQYGWLDESGENIPTEKSIQSLDLKRLFWANVFGPDLVKRIGKQFLQGAPVWKCEELINGDVLMVCSSSFVEWLSIKNHPVKEYFKMKYPEIRIYRSKGVK